MDPSENLTDGNRSDQQKQKRQVQHHSIHKDSHKIKKPPKPPAPPYAAREPVVIYAVSPKVVHATTSEFMNVVERLTGISSGFFVESSGGGDFSPAARLAATENARPRGGKEPVVRDETVEMTMEEAAEYGGYAPGILSPPPAMLPTASAGINIGSPSTRRKYDYDVVIRCKKGGDINYDDFTCYLRAALCRRGISVYEDDSNEVDAIPECRILILLLTSTDAPSNLINIRELQLTGRLVVYPIFYRIPPYGKPRLWKDALDHITEMPGYSLTDKSESELIDEIVRDASKVLCSSDNKVNMIGIDMQVEESLSLLCIESLDVRSIGLWGMLGLGKTTIAEEIFRRISLQYETCVFFKDIHNEVDLKGRDAVREDFFSKVLEVEPHVIRISDMKTSFLRSRLQRKKVLIILDDVNDYRDVETFFGKLNYLGPGSRIIMTSRNRRVFVLCKIDHVYEVKPLDISMSLQLLDRGTFQTLFSPEVYRTLSLELVKFSNGNPQVLQFFSSSDRDWKGLSQQIQKTSPIHIPGIFERSCCGLDDNERSIFLDIACFFRRMDKDNVAMLLDGCGFSAHVGFRSLVDKSLLTISHNMVDMLRFIQATGREIVRQESADKPGDRSRLWNTKDIMDVFVGDTGTSAIEGIFLDMLNVNFDANPNVFEKMCNLRLLKFYYSEVTENRGVSLPQGLDYLPSKLRLLHWENYPLSSLPRCFDPKNLVELNLSSSCATKLWKGKKSLEKLKRMILSHSYQLTKIPRLSSAPNLELLDLEGCTSLVGISQSICYLKKLVSLNLKDCLKLESIPSMVDLESLEVLNFSGCSKLENFPEISPNVKETYMGGTMIQEIPSSIKNLVLLKKLYLENNKHLKNLPKKMAEEVTVGFRFYPTEDELVAYLQNKLDGRSDDSMHRVIPVLNVFEVEPSHLPNMAGERCRGDSKQWFFFVPRQECKERGGITTGSGYWKGTGSPRPVFSKDNRMIGVKKTMVFYTGIAPAGRKTEWAMNEYRAVDETVNDSLIPKLSNEFSLCRVYITTGSSRAYDRRPVGVLQTERMLTSDVAVAETSMNNRVESSPETSFSGGEHVDLSMDTELVHG